MVNFTNYRSFQSLKKLSESPLDLIDPKNLTEQRIENSWISGAGLRLFYGFEKVDHSVLAELANLALEAKALEKMHLMQNGHILNKIDGFESENRQVLHTAMRDFFSDKNQSPYAKEAANLAEKEYKKLHNFSLKIEKDAKFDTIVQIGIGGSDLGPKAIYLALEGIKHSQKKVFFVSNVDPDDAVNVIQQIDLKKSLFIVVSKSGTTLETLTNEKFFRDAYEKLNIPSKEHFIAVTGEGSPMDNPKNYLESFYIWDFVGGRYSATSMVGGVVISLSLGFDTYREFLEGASEMDKIALQDDIYKNLPLFGALIGIWNHNFLSYPTLAVIPYSQALSRFPAHLQQLDMESNGKQICKDGKFCNFSTGPVIWGEPGTNGQHSFYQLIHQGTQIVPVCFIGFQDSQRGKDWKYDGTTSHQKLNANLLAQALSLAIGQKNDNPNRTFLGNRPNHMLLAQKLTPKVCGSLLSYFEHKVAFQGFIWGINSFDQEGVQLGKVLAKEFLNIMSEKKSPSDFPIGRVLLKNFTK